MAEFDPRIRAHNALPNAKRRAARARKFMVNTCPASRHLHMMALRLAAGKPYHMIEEEPEHVAASMLSVLESLWKLRTRAIEAGIPAFEVYPLSPRPSEDERA